MSVELPESIQFLHKIEIGLGAWAWGDRMVWNYGRGYTDEDIEAGFKVSLENGVNFVDTAEIYGNGRSERLLGQFVKNTDLPVFVATKFFPMPWRWTSASVTGALRASLTRLGMEHVDLYQIHMPSPIVPIETYAEGLASAQQHGLTRAVGVSNYDKNQMQRAYRALAKFNVPLASNQVEYHLLDRSAEKNGLLALCQELGVRLIAYSPLAMGLLTGKYTPETPPPGDRARRYGWILKSIQPLIRLMNEIGQDHSSKSAAQVALNWCICKGALPIPGAKNYQQAAMNAGAAGWRLAAEQIKALDDASDKIAK
jgi:aryl-alcohol dehydrogenase-like predicted oxidoreductase